MDWLLDLATSPQFAGGVVSGWVTRMVMVHLLARVDNDVLRKLLGRAWVEARSVFDDTYNAFVVEMAKAKADGVVTDEERAAAKSAAWKAAKKHIGWRMLAVHGLKILGAKPDEWISGAK